MSLLWMAVITAVVLQMSVFFTTIYLHRAKTHRGLELHPLVGALMHLELDRSGEDRFSLFLAVDTPRHGFAVS